MYVVLCFSCFFPGACFSHSCYVKTSTPRANWIKLADFTEFSDGLSRHELHRFHRYWYEVPKFNHHLLDHLDLFYTSWHFFTLPVTRGRSCFSKNTRLTCALGNGVRSKNSLRSLESYPGFEGIVEPSKALSEQNLPSLKLTRNQQPNHKVVGLFFFGWGMIFDMVGWSAKKRKLATFPFFWSVYWPLTKFHRNCAMWLVW